MFRLQRVVDIVVPAECITRHRAPQIRPDERGSQHSTFAWLSKCRAILVRYDKDPQHYLGLLQFACALLWYRRLLRQRAAK